MISVKPITCRYCSKEHAFQTMLITKVDDEGMATQSGWNVLRDHIDKEHPETAAKLDEWIYGSTEHKAPDWLDNAEAALG